MVEILAGKEEVEEEEEVEQIMTLSMRINTNQITMILIMVIPMTSKEKKNFVRMAGGVEMVGDLVEAVEDQEVVVGLEDEAEAGGEGDQI